MPEADQEFLADHFGGEKPIGLVADRVGREVHRTLGEAGGSLSDHCFQILPKECAYGHVGAEVPSGRFGEGHGDLLLGNAVDLVDQNHHLRRISSQPLSDPPVPRADGPAGVQHERDRIGVGQSPVYQAVEAVAQLVARLVQARGVHQHHLP